MNNQRGVVSLITSILISLLFVVVVVAMVNVLTREQHQASDADQASRAYYAAETGIEDGLAMIKTALASPSPAAALTAAENGGNCISKTDLDTNAGYTCMVLARQSNVIDGILQKDGVGEQIDLSNIPNIGKIVIDWNRTGQAGNDAPLNNLAQLPSIFQSGGVWGDSPAVIEASTIRFKTDASGLFDATDQSQLNILENIVVPSPSGGTVSDYASSLATHNPDMGICNAATTAANPYNCHVTLTVTDSATYKHILRLRARYTGTHFAVKVYDTAGNLITIPDQYETIDVTAKAGDTARRVRAKVAIYQNTAALDYALFSDHDICKDFELRDSRTGSGGNTVDSANVGSCPF